MTRTRQLETPSEPWTLVLNSNTDASTYATKTPTSTKPSGGAVETPFYNHGLMQFFGTDADNETFSARVVGWKRLGVTKVWVPYHLGTVDLTLSSQLTGAQDGENNGTPNGVNDFFADEIVITDAADNLRIVPGILDTVPPSLLLDLKGCQMLEVLFNLGSAASANGLLASL